MERQTEEIQWKLPELLAPAGGFEQLKAAVENGADAVYMGGKLFNARIGADNFDARQLEEAIAYAHLRGVKIHVTVNTLLTDRELTLALAETMRLYEEGADAFIIQDLGFARVLHRSCPEIPMHLSTQGTVYNAEGVLAAGQLGFSRVVLARETSLDEIAQIKERAGGTELEVFVHGALCISYSGQCQMSRHIGGRSGNRGVCAQPCRLPWTLHAEEKGTGCFGSSAGAFCVAQPSLTDCSAGQSGLIDCGAKQPSLIDCGAQPFQTDYPLSPRDLCGIAQLPALCRLGVNSLKIEGRMKSAEYVAVVTSIYRRYLDQCRELLEGTGGQESGAKRKAQRGKNEHSGQNERTEQNERTGQNGRIEQNERIGQNEQGKLEPQMELLPRDEEALRQIFSRGAFTEGYFRKNPGRGLMSEAMAKHQGILIGTVAVVNPERKQVTIRLSGALSMGDGIEIHTRQKGGGRLPGNVVTLLRGEKGQTLRQAEAGETVIAGDIDLGRNLGQEGRAVRPGDSVYRITEKRQLQEARASFENRSGALEKEGRKTPVEFDLETRQNQPAVLRVNTLPLWEGQPVHQALAQSESPVQPARNRPLTEEAVREQMEKTGGTPFRMAACKANLEENISLPVSQLNALRRRALEALEQNCLGKKEPFSAERRRRAEEEAANAVGQAFETGGQAGETVRDCWQRAGSPSSKTGGKRVLYLFRTDESFYRELKAENCREGKFDRYYLPYLDFLDPKRAEWLAEAGESLSAELIPALPQITQGEQDQFIRKNWDRLVQAALVRGGISVGNLGWLKPFLKEGVSVYGDFGLNLYSSADFALAGELGLAGGVISHELTGEQASRLCFHGLETEFAAGGFMPLMVSRHNFLGDRALTQGILEDRKGAHYPLIYDPIGRICTIFSSDRGNGRNLKMRDNPITGLNQRFYGFR